MPITAIIAALAALTTEGERNGYVLSLATAQIVELFELGKLESGDLVGYGYRRGTTTPVKAARLTALAPIAEELGDPAKAPKARKARKAKAKAAPKERKASDPATPAHAEYRRLIAKNAKTYGLGLKGEGEVVKATKAQAAARNRLAKRLGL